MLVTLADGQQERFGYNQVNTSDYIPPFGSSDTLTHNSSGTWTLLVPGGVSYTFTSGYALSSITDPGGLSQSFTENSSGQVTTMTDGASQRTLTITWFKPTGATYDHVQTVTTNPPQPSLSGLTWTYTYSGDELTGVTLADRRHYQLHLRHHAVALLHRGHGFGAAFVLPDVGRSRIDHCDRRGGPEPGHDRRDVFQRRHAGRVGPDGRKRGHLGSVQRDQRVRHRWRRI